MNFNIKLETLESKPSVVLFRDRGIRAADHHGSGTDAALERAAQPVAFAAPAVGQLQLARRFGQGDRAGSDLQTGRPFQFGERD